MRFEVEGAGDQHVEGGVGGLPRTADEFLPSDRAELRSDQNARSALRSVLALGVPALGADQVSRPRVYRGEGDAVGLVCLLDASRRHMSEDHRGEVFSCSIGGRPGGDPVNQLVTLVEGQEPVR